MTLWEKMVSLTKLGTGPRVAYTCHRAVDWLSPLQKSGATARISSNDDSRKVGPLLFTARRRQLLHTEMQHETLVSHRKLKAAWSFTEEVTKNARFGFAASLLKYDASQPYNRRWYLDT